MGILSGIKVLDVATYIAGPAAATVMSDFGAEVVKVERPPYGDPYRYLGQVPGMPLSEEAYCWLLDARNKRSVGLDLGKQGAREVMERMVRWADVMVTNFQPQQLQKFRLRYEDVQGWNERLIYAQVTGYGERGEEVDRPGFDSTAYWARSGLMGIVHAPDADPVTSPAGIGDHPTAMALFGAIMMGLYQREKTGKGMKVGTSLLGNGAWSNSCQIQAAMVGAEWVARRPRSAPNSPFVNHYVSQDGHRFMLCLLEPQRDWVRMCRLFGWVGMEEDERFLTPGARRANARELVEMIDAEAGARTMVELRELFDRHEVVWSPVPTLDEIARDEQMVAAGVFGEIEGTGWKTVMSPVEMGGEAKEKPRLAPGVGQHSGEVLRGLGYGEEEIRGLADRGVIAGV